MGAAILEWPPATRGNTFSMDYYLILFFEHRQAETTSSQEHPINPISAKKEGAWPPLSSIFLDTQALNMKRLSSLLSAGRNIPSIGMVPHRTIVEGIVTRHAVLQSGIGHTNHRQTVEQGTTTIGSG